MECTIGELHLDGQRGAHAVDVDLVGVEALGLEEELVMRLVGKLDDLVFDGRAVARADGLDLAGVHGRAMHVFADDAKRLRRGVGDVAADLAAGAILPGAEAEGRGIGVAGLLLEARPVDGAAVEARRRSGLQAAVAQAEALRLRRAARRPVRRCGPAGYCCSPQWMRPLRKVPVVMMTAPASTCGHRAGARRSLARSGVLC